ncbi:N-acetyltransferase [Neorhizobium sp. P12A]|uniref:GNAT family N-acetyltransferase n=1 Tax=Rhizobium/Agrobacterium group TaxID=227290 RepID=UPI00104A1A13|nr:MULTISPECIES: GNAT family N-acetyltransferase [Rhizobium/Agrobacterium group]KAA0689562.1 N-acetyltransferase [Neorhizobium sp. P12A]TCR92726.1 RimJ/RimL family protein N-acetyltransferase [Rhizobium sp. BK376]
MSEPYRLPDEFETKRYLVRRIRPSDADAIFAGWSSDPEVTKYLIWPPHTDISQTRDFAERGDRDWRDGVSFPAVISPLDAPQMLIGMVHPRPLARRVSYGWLIRRDHWGQGVASEVVAYTVDHALSHPAIFRAEATCDVDNIASARVMEKAGMVREGLLRRHGLHPNVSDEPRDSFLYAKVR